jgi:hypothetical protein
MESIPSRARRKTRVRFIDDLAGKKQARLHSYLIVKVVPELPL